jgi:hypothetical protein
MIVSRPLPIINEMRGRAWGNRSEAASKVLPHTHCSSAPTHFAQRRSRSSSGNKLLRCLLENLKITDTSLTWIKFVSSASLMMRSCRVMKGKAIMSVLAQPERQSICLGEMMQRLAIEPAGGVVPRVSLSYATAFHRCEACPSKQACRDWLDSMPRSVAFAPLFCPNADILFELQVSQPGRPYL